MVAIDKDKPLPEHTKLDYYECYAKVILEELFPKMIGKLELSDKPDLISEEKSLGIEVTIADSPEHKEAEKLWYMMKYKEPQQQEKDKERMRQLGVEYEGGIQSWPVRTYTSDLRKSPINWVIIAFQNKAKKLNSGTYKFFNHNALFIHSDVFLNDEYAWNLFDIFAEENSKNIKYEKVFLTTSGDIFLFDLEKKKVSKIAYSSFHHKQYEMAETARQMVEEGELNDQT